MAAQKDEAETKKKRKKIITKKLLPNQRVEVRSMEEGFLGSWHVGTVIECGEQTRHIKYDEVLTDDGSEYLVELVKVSPVLDGLAPGDFWSTTYYRGNIRPFPPSIDFQKWSLHYGQCVDALVQDAWWEGVIFDHEDGSDERKVFFPDLGDELKARLDMLRITQEWDEPTEEWKLRGNWVLLELLEEVELAWPLLVSVRQIWYEIRINLGFEKLKEWTYYSRDIWKELLWQVLCTSYTLTMKQIFHEIISAGDFAEEGQQLLEFSEPAFDAILKPGGAIVPCGTNSQLDTYAMLPNYLNNTCSFPAEEEITPDVLVSGKLDGSLDRSNLTNSMPSSNEVWSFSSTVPSISLPNRDNNTETGSATNSKRCNSFRSDKKLKWKHEPSAGRTRLHWLSAGSDMVLGAECCPNSVTDYIKMFSSSCGRQHSLKYDVRKHLLYLRWKIQYARDGRVTRMRYISPKGKIYDSLYQACLGLPPGEDIHSQTYQDNERNNVDLGVCLISPQLTEKRQERTAASKMLYRDHTIRIKKVYCPQAVVDYSQSRKGLQICHFKTGGKAERITSKARKHLSAVGWAFSYYGKRDRKQMRYESPCGRIFYSLLTACAWCMRDCSPSNSHSCKQVRGEGTAQLTFKNSSSTVCMESEGLNSDWSKELLIEPSSGKSLPKRLVRKCEVKVPGTKKLPKKRKRGLQQKTSSLFQPGPRNDDSSFPEKINDSQASVEDRDDMNVKLSGRMLRSSKRARQVAVSSSAYQTPRTILSWLIDGNIVLPRAKVNYRGKNDGPSIKEGKITREGIKCTCCQKVFTLSKFEAHAGSNYHRSSSNIFLEDGRSLFECQLQLKRANNVRNTRPEPQAKGNQRRHANDYICSICHYGGELVLCDQCPSSFHTRCLGLKDIPDGDWFCPSCCCGICGLGKFKEGREQVTDGCFLNCGQCEHQYHIGCLRIKGLVKPNYQSKGNWFCNKKCEQIHLGLQNLLGKQIPVGCDNLAWTLLKNKSAEDSDNDDNEHLMESYSKLNIALSIMHECFEPLKEPRTKRDLVEDVVFSRWSELHRLNFLGFYTVLLERNDELITVATVRVYGEKVAEIPLVATRFQYRRLGMCRILMNELEKKLMDLGVERLVLPAVPSVLNTWVTSFGFSTMKDYERLKFLDCTFLDFQGTIMCQKLLKNIPSPEFIVTTEVQKKACDHISENEVDVEGNSAVSEVFQEDRVEESEIVDHGTADILRGTGSNVGNGSAPSVIAENQLPEPVNQTPPVVVLACQNEVTIELSAEARSDKVLPGNARNNISKVYKRRIGTCRS